MKRFALVLASLAIIKTQAQIGIGINPPDPSAMLHVQDTAKGLLIPRMTATQRSAIVNPAEGLLVYQTNSAKGLWQFINGIWQNIVAPNNGGKHTLYLSDGITNTEAQAKIAAEVGPNTQEVRILRCNNLTSVDLSMITNLTEIYLSGNTALQNINLANLQSVDGGIFIDQCPSLASLPAPLLQTIGQTVGGTYGLQLTNSGVTSLNFPLLTRLTGKIYINNNSALSSIAFPQLAQHTITGINAFTISLNPLLASISCPLLTAVGDVWIFDNYNLASVGFPVLAIAKSFSISKSIVVSLSFPALTMATEDLNFDTNNALNMLSLPVLATVSSIRLGANAALLSLSLPLLTTVGGSLSISNSFLSSLSVPVLTTAGTINIQSSPFTSLSFPSLTGLTNNIAASAIYSCSSLTSVSMNGLANFANTGFDVIGCKLSSSQINYLLNKFVTIIPLISNKSFDFQQSIPAPPTGQGIIDKATLIARFNTVDTD